MVRPLIVRGARQNNLQNINLEIPTQQLVVITGLSGSGKSSLAFETIYAEGHRRFLDSLSNYARQFLIRVEKPDVDGMEGLAPTIAIEQKNPIRTSRSTVGTVTEIYDFLRVLFARAGTPICPNHKTPMESLGPERIGQLVVDQYSGQKGYIAFPVKLSRTKKDRTLQLTNLRARGFSRILLGEEANDFYVPLLHTPTMKNFEDLEPKDLPKGSHPAWIVADRMSVDAAELQRLREALTTALREGLGVAAFIPTTGAPVILSSLPRCHRCGEKIPDLSPQLFSFNSPMGACSRCNGFGRILVISEAKVVPIPTKSIAQGAVDPFTKPSTQLWSRRLRQFCEMEDIDVHTAWEDLPAEHRKLVLEGQGTYKGVFGMFHQLEEKRYRTSTRVFINRYQDSIECSDCQGSRVRSEALHVLVAGKTIHDTCSMSLAALHSWVCDLEKDEYLKKAMSSVTHQLKSRLSYLVEVGVGYLTCHRQARSLSGGEIQRINLANQLGADLTRTFYILDEPTVGLHPRDTHRLISIMKNLRERGNTLFVVEHDRDVMKSADWLVDMGPGAGREGGKVLFNGPMRSFEASKTLTSQYLSERKVIPLPRVRRKSSRGFVEIIGCKGNNLKDVTLKVPLGRMTVVTGVSGSGKSTLVRQTLYPAVARALQREVDPPLAFREVRGVEKLSDCLLLDQSAIGRTPRMIPMTYLKIFDSIRFLFAEQMQAKQLGLRPGDFSFNVKGGRCEKCEGEGYIRVDMHFMDDLFVKCEECDGRRFQERILKVKVDGKNIHDVLSMTVDEGMKFFHSFISIYQGLNVLHEVGLGYLGLGQPATTLSGGEAQRLKIAREFFSRQGRNILYVLDEPTTGLHFEDTRKLIDLLNRLVESGNTVLVVEHNLDVIKSADWVVDIGPGASDEGGRVVIEGTPEDIVKCKSSLMAPFLKDLVMPQASI